MHLKKYANLSIAYAAIAMAGGVFFREFTKFNEFDEKTNLAFLHTHYFILGMFFFLVMMLIEKNFNFSDKKTDKFFIMYNIGLNITGCTLLARGIIQTLEVQLSSSINAMVSGIAGIGHIILGISIIMILISIKKSAKE